MIFELKRNFGLRTITFCWNKRESQPSKSFNKSQQCASKVWTVKKRAQVTDYVTLLSKGAFQMNWHINLILYRYISVNLIILGCTSVILSFDISCKRSIVLPGIGQQHICQEEGRWDCAIQLSPQTEWKCENRFLMRYSIHAINITKNITGQVWGKLI